MVLPNVLIGGEGKWQHAAKARMAAGLSADACRMCAASALLQLWAVRRVSH